MKKVVDYIIVDETFLSSLDMKVNNLIKENWTPQGGISFNNINGKYLQAMVYVEE